MTAYHSGITHDDAKKKKRKRKRKRHVTCGKWFAVAGSSMNFGVLSATQEISSNCYKVLINIYIVDNA